MVYVGVLCDTMPLMFHTNQEETAINMRNLPFSKVSGGHYCNSNIKSGT